ncbi:MAG TPA: type II toxin-antitoxin system HicB family antitoxin [Ktedonobacterales bacterium]|nr:type II toxin-antitoxin system HicB family antitoxin [Ktedonobacterales bacterium]
MFAKYLHAAMARATYETLDDRTYYGSIPNFQGVWANAPTLEACRDELEDALEGWILLRIADHLELPSVDDLTLVVSGSV